MVRLGTLTEVPATASTLARAFCADPVLAPLVGHRSEPRSALTRYFEIEARLALSGRGEVWVDDDLLGAAIWHRPGSWPQAAHTPVRALLSYLRVFSRRFPEASRVATTLAREHPREPHWYLPFIGVLPEAAGAGRGSSLLTPVLSLCDREKSAAYLEATSEASARLFERFGFRRTDEIELPTRVTVRPMWREPITTP